MELRALLDDARQVAEESVRVALLEEVVGHADPVTAPNLAVTARLELAGIHCARGRWLETFAVFDECLRMHDEQPWHFAGAEENALLTWYAFILDSMIDFPDVPLARIRTAMDDVERRLRAGGRSLHPLTAARRRLAQSLGDWPGEEAAFQRWLIEGGALRHDSESLEWRLERLLLRGDPASLDEAFAMMAPVLSGRQAVRGDPVPLVCHLLLPLARAGRYDEAVAAHRFVRVAMARGAHRYEYLAMRMEFCALTGNADAAFDLLSLLDGLDGFERAAGRMHFATAVAVLTAAYQRAGRGELLVGFGDGEGVPMWLLHERMRAVATGVAAEFDARNGTTACGDRVRARLAAEPVVDFLPLRPGSIPPVDVRPPAGLTDEALLARARWHDMRCEIEPARACLAAVRDAAGTLAAHVVELRARLHRAADPKDTCDALEWAIARHRENGEETTALLAECWLGLQRGGPDGFAFTARAAGALRAGTDDEAAGWGALWYAYSLTRAGRDREACEALRAGATRAAAHPLAAGVLTRIEAAWRNQLADDPAVVKTLARRAVELFLKAGAGQRAVEAVGDLAAAHTRAGTLHLFAAYVDKLLHRLPDGEPAQLRGHLRYLRGYFLVAGGRAGEAVDDLYDALAQTAARQQDTTAAQYHLMLACHAAGRIDEALDLAVTVGHRLDLLNEAHAQPEPDWADRCRLILADCYDRSARPDAALEEYERLIDGLVRRGATAGPIYRQAVELAGRLRS